MRASSILSSLVCCTALLFASIGAKHVQPNNTTGGASPTMHTNTIQSSAQEASDTQELGPTANITEPTAPEDADDTEELGTGDDNSPSRVGGKMCRDYYTKYPWCPQNNGCCCCCFLDDPPKCGILDEGWYKNAGECKDTSDIAIESLCKRQCDKKKRACQGK